MPRMRVEKRLRCAACQHYRKDRNSFRCTLKANTFKHWMGLAYYLHPDHKNYNGRCEDYEETD